MRELAKKILQKIEYSKEDSAIFEDFYEKEIKLSGENFHQISKKESLKKIAFIDGGNLEILKAPSFSLFFNRTYFTIYQNNNRIKSELIEFYSIITAKSKSEKIYYETEYFFTKGGLDLKNYEFYSFDKSIMTGNRRAQISVIGDIIRRFAEIETIKKIKEEEIIIFLDGSLEAIYPNETELLEEAYNSKKQICGISKTSNQITKKGNTLAAYLLNSSPYGEWYYDFNNKRGTKVDLFYTKLNPKTEYLFRLDISNEHNYDIDEIIFLLKQNSRDPIFLGYPYGMVEADRFARVTKKEKEALQMQLKIYFGKDFDKIKPFLNTLNAHDILDRIS